MSKLDENRMSREIGLLSLEDLRISHSLLIGLRNAFRTLSTQVPSVDRDLYENQSREYMMMCRLLLQAIINAWDIKIPSDWGVDCSVVSAITNGLQDAIEINQIMYHSMANKKDHFKIILNRGTVVDFHPPVVIDFDDISERRYTNTLMIGDFGFLSPFAIYMYVDLNVKEMYTSRRYMDCGDQISAIQIVPENPKNLIDLCLMLTKAVLSRYDFALYATHLMQELNLIRSPDVLHRVVDPRFLSRYILGWFASTERLGSTVFMLQPKANHVLLSTTLLIEDETKQFRSCFNIIESSEKISYDSPYQLIGEPIGDGIKSDEVVVSNLFVGFEHEEDDYVSPFTRTHDYVEKGLFLTKIKYEKLTQMFNTHVIPYVALEHDLKEILSRNQNKQILMEKLDSIFAVKDNFVNNEMNINAVGAGLMHYAQKSKSMYHNMMNEDTFGQTLELELEPIDGGPSNNRWMVSVDFFVDVSFLRSFVITDRNQLTFNIVYTTSRDGTDAFISHNPENMFHDVCLDIE